MTVTMIDYANKREARRRQNVIFLIGYVVCMGVVVALLAHGALRVTLVSFFAIALVVNAGAMLRPVRPAKLIPLNLRVQSGIWPANVRALSVAGDTSRGKFRTTNFAELTGQVEFTSAGVVWRPSATTSKSFGIAAQTWDPSWQIQARRLPGLGSQAQVTLTHADVPEPMTIWLRRASSFRIE
jgi:hypothetical protein